MLTASFVVLTLGNRANDLSSAIESIRASNAQGIEIVLIVNGPENDAAYPVAPHFSGQNLGIPGGRNLGAKISSGEILFFLDDDATVLSSDLVPATLSRFAADEDLGAVSFAIKDETSGQVQRRHIPRLTVSEPGRSSYVTTFLGGACAIRRSVFQEIGGYFAGYWYGHEETDLAWRMLEADYTIWYDGENWVGHPEFEAHREPGRLRQSVRNRVWLARRLLPMLIFPIYLSIWTLITIGRARSRAELKEVISGLSTGFSESCGDRRPLSWGTIWKMTKLGRPPII
jgi:GT2 family glycosyltransferase